MQARNDNNEFLTYRQAIALTGAFVLFAGLLVFCGQSIIATTPPPRTASAPATPSPLYVVLAEQASNATVQVITAEEDKQPWGWYAVPVGFIFIGLGVGYWGLRYGRRGQL